MGNRAKCEEWVDRADGLCGESAHDLGDNWEMLVLQASTSAVLCIPCRATTLKMKTTERVITTTGSTFSPGDSSVYSPDYLVSHFSFPIPRLMWLLGVHATLCLETACSLPHACVLIISLNRVCTYSTSCLSCHRHRRPLCCSASGLRSSQRGQRPPSFA
jgi:hypothetical protein